MHGKDNVILFKPVVDLTKIRELENALLKYIERYGLTSSASLALDELAEIQATQRYL